MVVSSRIPGVMCSISRIPGNLFSDSRFGDVIPGNLFSDSRFSSRILGLGRCFIPGFPDVWVQEFRGPNSIATSYSKFSYTAEHTLQEEKDIVHDVSSKDLNPYIVKICDDMYCDIL